MKLWKLALIVTVTITAALLPVHASAQDVAGETLAQLRAEIAALKAELAGMRAELKVIESTPGFRGPRGPQGVAGIFDGDFAYKTFAQEDPQQAKAQDDLINNTMTANPYVMRLMPRYLKQAGLELTDFFPYVLAEVGQADFWKSSLEANRRLIPQTGIMTRHEADAWASGIMKSSDEGVFFGANNYYAYVVRKP